MWHPIGLRGTVGLGPNEMAAKVRQLREQATRIGRTPGSVGVAFRAPLDVWPARPSTRDAEPPSVAPPLCGPPAKIVDDIRAYQRAGVRSFVFDFARPDAKVMLETMRRFAREIRPRVARPPRDT